MSELKPCPFCGHESRLVVGFADDEGFNVSMIQCKAIDTCGVYLSNVIQNTMTLRYTEEELIKQWNTRANAWISVKDELPPFGKWVLCYYPGEPTKLIKGYRVDTSESSTIAPELKGKLLFDDGECGTGLWSLITHWRELDTPND